MESETKKMMFVYNPYSGKAQIKNHLYDIINLFSNAGYEITIHATNKPKDAMEISENLDDSYDLLVCCGGDGTLDEVVTGRRKAHKKYPIGYIPAGSTNDFASSLCIPNDMAEAAEHIIHGNYFYCDLGKFNDDVFVYVAAFGFLAEVSYETSQDLKNMFGHSAYVFEAMKRMTMIKAHHMVIEYLDEHSNEERTLEGDYIIGMITNSDSVGGMKKITGPEVYLNDGLFEVTLIPELKNPFDFSGAFADIVMNDFEASNFTRFKTSKIRLHSSSPVSWTLDGENGGDHEDVLVTVQKEKLCILLKDYQN